jgi:O-antigen ligase
MSRVLRAAAALGAAVFILCLIPALADARVPVFERALLLAAVLAAAGWPRPAALTLVAGLPLSFLGIVASPFHFTEAVVVAALTGWSIRATARGFQPPPKDFMAFVFLAVSIVACSTFVVFAGANATSETSWRAALAALRHDYFYDRGALEVAAAGMADLESLGLLVAASILARSGPEWRRAFMRMFVAGASGLALLSVHRLLQIALRSGDWQTGLMTALQVHRISVSYGDVNAAGSYFAMAGCVAVGLTLTTRRRNAAIAALSVAILLVATWVTGSRAAVAALLLGTLILLAPALTSKRTRLLAGTGLGVCLAVAIAFVLLFPNRLTGTAASVGWLVRIEMGRIAVAMLAAHPWFGVGVGRFYALSAAYIPATRLAGVYVRENAHNNFLQIAAEFGISGMAVLAWGAWQLAKSSWRCRSNPDQRIFVAAIASFAATLFFGHPLLIPDVAYSFALLAGVAMAGPGHAASRRSGRAAVLICAGGVLLLSASLPVRLHQVFTAANFDGVAWGVGAWQTQPDGTRFRTIGRTTTLFIPPDAVEIELPYRLIQNGAPVTLAVTLGGRTADPILVASTAWHTYRLRVPSGGNGYGRLVLTASSTSDNIALGQLRINGHP